MILSGLEIQEIYNYAKKHGFGKEYILGKDIPLKDGGFKRYISTPGHEKYNILHEVWNDGTW